MLLLPNNLLINLKTYTNFYDKLFFYGYHSAYMCSFLKLLFFLYFIIGIILFLNYKLIYHQI